MEDQYPDDFTGCRPVLPTVDLDASIEYYVDILGFTLDWIVPSATDTNSPAVTRTAYVFRGHFELLLKSQPTGVHSAEIVVGLPSVDAVNRVHQEFVASGARIEEPPSKRKSGTYEMLVLDRDEHRLRILH